MPSRVVVNSLPIGTFLSHTGKNAAKHILARDRARAQKLLAGLHPHGPVAHHTSELRRRKHRTHKKPAHAPADPSTGTGDAGSTDPESIDVTDAGVTYTASVAVGSPATNFTLLIDTGSSNTWVGASTKYTPTSTATDTGNTVQVSYGSGSFSGEEWTDQVDLSGGDGTLVIQQQSIGVASQAQGFTGVDGILGIGPVDLTDSTLSNGQPVPTVTDNLFSQGTISSDSIGISFEPSSGTNDGNGQTPNIMNGELTFGGTDTSKTSGEITFVPITSTSPASQYWGIDQSVTYGDSTNILSSTAGIVDTGTTLLMLATDAFQAYQKATGATADQTTGLLTLTSDQFSNLQSLFFSIGGTTFEFTANAQIWPRSLNSVLGGEEGKIYLIVSDLGSPSGQGLDFINGFGWLQRYYSVFDTTNSQVGIANTPFTTAETN